MNKEILHWTIWLLMSLLKLGLLGQEQTKLTNRWEQDIIAFEAADSQNPPPEKPVVFVGSSSIRKWHLETYFPGEKFINRGFGGAKISDVVFYADRIITNYQPTAVVIYVGGNDIGARRAETRRSAESVYQDFKKLCTKIHAKNETTPILYISIKPSIKKQPFWPEMQKANAMIKMHAEKNPFVRYIDIVSLMLDEEGKLNPEWFLADGGHLSEKGYSGWSNKLRPILNSIPQTK
jgi:lysophospholipase L1-like esterase